MAWIRRFLLYGLPLIVWEFWSNFLAQVSPEDAQHNTSAWWKYFGLRWPESTTARVIDGLAVVAFYVTLAAWEIAERRRKQRAEEARITEDSAHRREAHETNQKVDEVAATLVVVKAEIIEAITQSKQHGADASGLKLRALAVAGEIAELITQWQLDLPNQPPPTFHPGYTPGHPMFAGREVLPEHEVKAAARFQDMFGKQARALHAEFAERHLRYLEWDLSLRRGEWPGGIRDVYAAMNGLQILARSLPDTALPA